MSEPICRRQGRPADVRADPQTSTTFNRVLLFLSLTSFTRAATNVSSAFYLHLWAQGSLLCLQSTGISSSHRTHVTAAASETFAAESTSISFDLIIHHRQLSVILLYNTYVDMLWNYLRLAWIATNRLLHDMLSTSIHNTGKVTSLLPESHHHARTSTCAKSQNLPDEKE